MPAEPKETDYLLQERRASERELLPGSSELQGSVRTQLWNAWMYWSSVTGFCIAWVAFGIFYLTRYANFDWIQAFYVTIEMATTIGYGDFDTDDIHGFLCIYIFGSVILLAYILNHYSDMLVHSTENLFEAHLKKLEMRSQGRSETQIMKLYGRFNDFMIASFLFFVCALVGTWFFSIYEGCTCLEAGIHIEGCERDHCRATGGRLLPWSSSIYMCIATMTTVGFGDRHPGTRMGMLFAIPWMVIGVATAANFVRAVTHCFLEHRSQHDYWLQEKVTQDMFDEIDTDHNGSMSRGEFRRFVLTRFNLVDGSILDEIDKQYDALAMNSVDFGGGADASQRGLTFEEIARRYDEVEEWETSHNNANM